MKIRILFLLFIYCFVLRANAQEIALPLLENRVTDLTGTLTEIEQEALENKLADLEKTKGSQVVVVIIPTTGNETIEQYSMRLAESWKIGRSGVDDGVILLFAMNDHNIRIEVGYGLEGALTDILSKRIITNVIVPAFRSGQYYQGIDRGVDIVLSVINGEELPPVVKDSPSESGGKSNGNPDVKSGKKSNGLVSKAVILLMAIGGIYLKKFLKKKFGNKQSWQILLAIAAVLIWIFAGLATLIGLALLVLLVSRFFIDLPSSASRRHYYGGGGSSGRGSSSGGGFSGGGGSFGGGGASGRW